MFRLVPLHPRRNRSPDEVRANWSSSDPTRRGDDGEVTSPVLTCFELMNIILLTDYIVVHKLCLYIFIWIKILLLQS